MATSDKVDTGSTRAYGGVGASERRLQRRQRFIEAGVEVFGTRGLGQSTMRDLCGEARLTDRYFYESFRRVEDVFEAVLADLTTQLVERLGSAMFAVPLRMDSVAEAGLRAFFGFMQEDPRRARIVLIDALSLRFSPARDRSVDPIESYVELLRALYNALYPQAAGLGIDVGLLAKTLIGMTIHSGAVWAHDGFDKSIDDMVMYNLFAWHGLDTWIKRLIADGVASPR
ncbi:MAG: TetR/AcrR family transcriptional regulator [Rubrivivax sp.]|nr:MAG: TetR/AcrR family transcriptional regulator [Rubrivivax sp.]